MVDCLPVIDRFNREEDLVNDDDVDVVFNARTILLLWQVMPDTGRDTRDALADRDVLAATLAPEEAHTQGAIFVFVCSVFFSFFLSFFLY